MESTPTSTTGNDAAAGVAPLARPDGAADSDGLSYQALVEMYDESMRQFTEGELVHGVVEASLFAGYFTYAADIVPESRRTEGIALFGVSGMLPVSLGPLIGDWILARADYPQLFAVSIGFAALSLLISLPLAEQRHEVHLGEASRGMRGPAFQRDLLPLWFVGTAFATAITAPFLFLKLFVEETGKTNGWNARTEEAYSAGCSKRPFSEAAASEETRRTSSGTSSI